MNTLHAWESMLCDGHNLTQMIVRLGLQFAQLGCLIVGLVQGVLSLIASLCYVALYIPPPVIITITAITIIFAPG